jgi:hypothetical protein
MLALRDDPRENLLAGVDAVIQGGREVAQETKTPGEPGVSAEWLLVRQGPGVGRCLPVRRLGAAGVSGQEGTHRGPHALRHRRGVRVCPQGAEAHA